MEIDFMYRLRKALEDKGITRTELSQISGIAKGDITHYLKGDYVPKQDKCYMLAKALDVDPGWLMTGFEQETKELKGLLDTIDKELDNVPQTPEARILAKGIDSMPEEQRKALFTMMSGLYPGVFEKGNEEDDT